jgi:hypothetical protein
MKSISIIIQITSKGGSLTSTDVMASAVESQRVEYLKPLRGCINELEQLIDIVSPQ